MRVKTFIVIVLMSFLSCENISNGNNANTEHVKETEKVDNKELELLFIEDQLDRSPESGKIDWELVLPRDSIRLVKVLTMVENGELYTSKDFYRAGTIFQHGYDTLASGLAVKMLQKAINIDSTLNKWLLAAAIDRDLQRRGKPQIFGIQFTKNLNGRWVLYDIDTTVIDDSTRRKYGVSTLSELRYQAEMMNPD